MSYDADWYREIGAGSLSSAATVAPLINVLIGARPSVLDVGCGTGAWAAQWFDADGVDGDWVPQDQLHLPRHRFHVVDLTQLIDMGRAYDLVICLEVAEHLPPDAAPTLVASLCRHADTVVFSAALPGQGGNGHINEQWPSYWATLFAQHGYQPYDLLRDEIWTDDRVDVWYKQNMLVFANDEVAHRRRWIPSIDIDRTHPDAWVRS